MKVRTESGSCIENSPPGQRQDAVASPVVFGYDLQILLYQRHQWLTGERRTAITIAITDPNVWLLAIDLVESARDDGLPIPAFGSLAHQTEIAEIVLLLVERLELSVQGLATK